MSDYGVYGFIKLDGNGEKVFSAMFNIHIYADAFC